MFNRCGSCKAVEGHGQFADCSLGFEVGHERKELNGQTTFSPYPEEECPKPLTEERLAFLTVS